MNMMKKIAALMIIMSVISMVGTGCLPMPTEKFAIYEAEHDQFKPQKTNYFIPFIYIKEMDFSSVTYSKFQLNYTINNGDKIWHIDTFFLSESWMFINKIILNINGKVFTVNSLPSPNREIGTAISSTNITEQNQFILSDEVINALRTAKTISLRLEGDHYYQDKVLDPVDVGHIVFFIDWADKKSAKT